LWNLREAKRPLPGLRGEVVRVMSWALKEWRRVDECQGWRRKVLRRRRTPHPRRVALEAPAIPIGAPPPSPQEVDELAPLLTDW
jgi:hypothetical protein